MSEVVRAARRVAFKVQPGKLEELQRTVRNEVVPRITGERGFRRHFLLQSKTDPSEVVAFSLWNREEDVEAYVNSGLPAENISRIRPYVIGEPIVSLFRVLEHKVGVQFKKKKATKLKPKAKKKPARKKR